MLGGNGMKLKKAEIAALIVTSILVICAVLFLSLHGESAEPPFSLHAAEYKVQPGASSAFGLLNINTATEEELCTLPGIGSKLALRIIAYRQEHGPFEHASEIIEVSGIGLSTFDGFKDLITVEE